VCRRQLDVIGPREDIERFCKLAVVNPPKRSDPEFVVLLERDGFEFGRQRQR
jgi:hypothetical protein